MALAANLSRLAHRTASLTSLGSGGLDAGTATSRTMLLRQLRSLTRLTPQQIGEMWCRLPPAARNV